MGSILQSKTHFCILLLQRIVNRDECASVEQERIVQKRIYRRYTNLVAEDPAFGVTFMQIGCASFASALRLDTERMSRLFCV